MTCIRIHKPKQDTQIEFILCLHLLFLCRRHPFSVLAQAMEAKVEYLRFCAFRFADTQLWELQGQHLQMLPLPLQLRSLLAVATPLPLPVS